jgi:hypothetical protein
MHVVNALFLVVFVIFFPPHGFTRHFAVPKRRFSVKQASAAPIFLKMVCRNSAPEPVFCPHPAGAPVFLA